MNKLPYAPVALLAAVLQWQPAAWAQAPVRHKKNTVHADVVAIDMPMVFNRLGAQNVNWQMYALRHDLVVRDPGKAPRYATDEDLNSALTLLRLNRSFNATLRPDLRPRPLVLRVAAGECLQVRFTNLLSSISNPFEAHNWPLLPASQASHPMDHRSSERSIDIDDQVASRRVGFHPNGLQLVNGIGSDASQAGANSSSLAGPGQTLTYTFFAPAEGSFLVTNPGAALGSEGTGWHQRHRPFRRRGGATRGW